ncbi:MAG: lipopolysaccharide biosynthesis protein [Halioglobus sp.]|nr:lipopolysaccharide biosynthesis protein [Halioglobus sp.]
MTDIRTRVMSALRWSAAARFFGQAISWCITIVVIRMLSPGDYGLMAMGTVLVSFLFLLNTLGLDAILVQEKNLEEHTRRQVFGVVILMNCAWFVLLYTGADAAARFYDEPALAPVVRVLSLQFLLLIFETLPQSQLEREIDFTRRSVVDFITLVLGGVVTLVLALLDYGVWALVWGMVANTAFRVIGLNLITRALVWPSFAFRGMRRHLAFGSFVTTDRGLWFLFSESDKFIGGKLLGQHALGYYAVAAQLASLPIQKLAGMLNAIAFPAFSRAHDDERESRVHEYLLTATRILSIAAFPVFFGIACTAQPIIAALLGEKWLPAVPLLQLLGLVMPFKLLSNVFPPLLWGIGSPRVSASNFAIAAVLMPLAFVAGAMGGGVMGLAYAWLLMYPVVFVITAWRSCSVVGVALGDYFAQLLRPALVALVMYAAVLLLAGLLPASLGPWPRLLLLAAAGAVLYFAGMLLVARQGLKETLFLIRA